MEKSFFEWMGAAKTVWVGMLGAAFAAWFTRRDIKSKTDAAVFILFGGAAAHFFPPLIMYLFNLPPDTWGAVGFGIGSIGGLLAKWAWHFIASGELTKFFHSRFGGSNQVPPAEQKTDDSGQHYPGEGL